MPSGPQARGGRGRAGVLSAARPESRHRWVGGRMKLLFDRIDEPGLNTLEVYERRGGYQALRKALAMAPEEVLQNISDSGLRGRGGAGFRMGQKAGFLPHGE